MSEQEMREKVIKGLECCDNDDCDNCPYFRSDDENDLGTCKATLHRDARVLLKAQEAVEPTIGRAVEYDGTDSWWYQCGKCEKPIDWQDNYCRHCGKPVKWE